MRRYLIGVVLAAALAGCASQATTNAVSTDVAATEIALTAAEQLALAYTSLPRCMGASKVCSDQATVTKIKSLDNTAYNAVIAARSNPSLVGLAVTAVSDFRNAIPGS